MLSVLQALSGSKLGHAVKRATQLRENEKGTGLSADPWNRKT